MKTKLNLPKINETELDKIRGGGVDTVYSGSGDDKDGGCSQEFMDMYDDGSWDYWYVPCD